MSKPNSDVRAPADQAPSRRPTGRGRIVALAVALSLTAAAVVTGVLIHSGSSAGSRSGGTSYVAKGKIVSLSADGSSVSIAHERIEGFMEAMTLEFQFSDPSQRDGLHEGDRVEFRFTATPDAKLVLNGIRAERR